MKMKMKWKLKLKLKLKLGLMGAAYWHISGYELRTSRRVDLCVSLRAAVNLY